MIDMGPSLRAAIVADATITGELSAYLGSYPVFTRRPIPDDAPATSIVISPDVAIGNQDFIRQEVPVIFRDVAVYGPNDTAANYRSVETIGYALRDLFHNASRFSVDPSGYRIIDIKCRGPFPAPTDDDKTVGRVVALTIRLTPTA